MTGFNQSVKLAIPFLKHPIAGSSALGSYATYKIKIRTSIVLNLVLYMDRKAMQVFGVH
jgi:hypothetical protein